MNIACMPAFLGALILLAACGPDTTDSGLSESAATVNGSVTYRERIALGETAVVEISLQDVSRADAPAIDIARQ